jgi:hypothetical protein
MGIYPQLANVDLAVYGDLAVGRVVILNNPPVIVYEGGGGSGVQVQTMCNQSGDNAGTTRRRQLCTGAQCAASQGTPRPARQLSTNAP